ncbi:MAG TPA: hypothetical protein VNS02_02530 [Rhizobiaceae bacterium]|nr:hypothetical protein [Rhizobiaceae bacterium]
MAPIIRIFLRYISMPLVIMGWILPEEQADIIADPELVFWLSQLIGWGIPFAVEGWYWLASKFGWAR